jgi:rhamnosyltransferase
MEKVFGIIVVYNPQTEVIDNIKHIITQVDQLLVVDNSSTQSYKEILQRNSPQVSYIWNGNTHGLAGALNKGIVQAQATGSDWIIFFDQDSCPSVGMVDTMLQFAQTSDNPLIVSLAPNYYDSNISKLYFNAQSPYQALDIITSGNLIRVNVFDNAANFFDESMVIYHLDTDLNLKLANSNYQLYRVPTAILNHNEGNKMTVNIPFISKPITLNNNTPFALFYIYRNTVVISKRYLLTHPQFIFLGYTNLFKNLVKLILFEHQKLPKLHAILKGLISGVLAR